MMATAHMTPGERFSRYVKTLHDETTFEEAQAAAFDLACADLNALESTLASERELLDRAMTALEKIADRDTLSWYRFRKKYGDGTNNDNRLFDETPGVIARQVLKDYEDGGASDE